MAAAGVLPMFPLLALLIFAQHGGADDADKFYRVCAIDGAKQQECQGLERGDSRVTCALVSDSVDCLLKLERGDADFGVLTSEETVLAAMENADRLRVLASVRHEDKQNQKFAFEAVAVVKTTHRNGLAGLAGGRFCHPGYGKGKEQMWSDRVLKYFENKVAMASRKCVKDSKSSAEDDAHELSRYFSAACRPGPWLLVPEEDKKLKAKFPSLCSLCSADSSFGCDGYKYFEPRAAPGAAVSSHLSALECLGSDRGTVAYVAYHHVQEYFKSRESEMQNYALLCQNGTLMPLTSLPDGQAPCAWIRQPWASLVARTAVADNLLKNLREWLPKGRSDGSLIWKDSLDSILFREKSDILEYINQPYLLTSYVTEGRPIPVPEKNACHKSLRWCTISSAEQAKCLWIQKASTSVGLQPEISCAQATSSLDCLRLVKEKRADFMSIDTNYGYLARKYYDLSTVIYAETLRKHISQVLAVTKEVGGSPITRFENLRGKNACFPEYGGIAWVAFIRAAHERKVISTTECDYAKEVGAFFGAACAPGATDPAHHPSKAVDPAKLCVCQGFPSGTNEIGINTGTQDCPADNTNWSYGTKGALRCLSEPNADVAFLEGQYISDYAANLSLKADDFRVLCRNGSMASYTGFKVDEQCALSNTIDSEIVTRRNDPDILSLKLFLEELDTWFGYNRPSVKLVDLQAFSKFNNTEDLLFMESTIGLATSDSTNEFVMTYIELFKHTDSCTGASTLTVAMPAFITLAMALMVYFIN